LFKDKFIRRGRPQMGYGQRFDELFIAYNNQSFKKVIQKVETFLFPEYYSTCFVVI
jgi:hypothetical protein